MSCRIKEESTILLPHCYFPSLLPYFILFYYYYLKVHVEAYNLFATAATDNVVSLWDLRAPSVVFRYSGHLNRRECVSIALSPCLRFLATGSEDRSARIVDVRGGKEIAKLQGHRDVVSGVAFNPLFPQLATCSFDGSVKFYVDPAASDTSMKGL